MRTFASWSTAGTVALALASPVSADRGWVVGAAYGFSEVGTACYENDDPAVSRHCETESTGRRLFAGYRRVDPQTGSALGFEIFRADFGSMSFAGEIDGVPVEGVAAVEGTGVHAVLEYRFRERWSLLSKLGACRWNVDARAGRSGAAPSYVERPDGVGFAVGVGLAWRLAERMALRFEIEGVGGVGDDNLLQDDAVTLASVGIALHF